MNTLFEKIKEFRSKNLKNPLVQTLLIFGLIIFFIICAIGYYKSASTIFITVCLFIIILSIIFVLAYLYINGYSYKLIILSTISIVITIIVFLIALEFSVSGNYYFRKQINNYEDEKLELIFQDIDKLSNQVIVTLDSVMNEYKVVVEEDSVRRDSIFFSQTPYSLKKESLGEQFIHILDPYSFTEEYDILNKNKNEYLNLQKYIIDLKLKEYIEDFDDDKDKIKKKITLNVVEIEKKIESKQLRYIASLIIYGLQYIPILLFIFYLSKKFRYMDMLIRCNDYLNDYFRSNNSNDISSKNESDSSKRVPSGNLIEFFERTFKISERSEVIALKEEYLEIDRIEYDKIMDILERNLVWIIRIGIIGTLAGIMLAFFDVGNGIADIIENPDLTDFSGKVIYLTIQQAVYSNGVAIITSLCAHLVVLLLEFYQFKSSRVVYVEELYSDIYIEIDKRKTTGNHGSYELNNLKINKELNTKLSECLANAKELQQNLKTGTETIEGVHDCIESSKNYCCEFNTSLASASGTMGFVNNTLSSFTEPMTSIYNNSSSLSDSLNDSSKKINKLNDEIKEEVLTNNIKQISTKSTEISDAITSLSTVTNSITPQIDKLNKDFNELKDSTSGLKNVIKDTLKKVLGIMGGN